MSNYDKSWIDYLEQKKQELLDKRSMIEDQMNTEISKLDEQLEQGLYGIKLKDVIDRFDYDGDGIVSTLDLCILWIIVNNEDMVMNDPLYNSAEHKYNGKLLDINNDSLMNITDIVNFINDMLDLPLTMTWNYNSRINEMRTYASNYYISNGTWPTWDETKTYMSEN